jgi:NADPH:quinone reductase-like Zn-dependent oxidoreductase
MRLEEDWGLENIRSVTLPDPEPGPDEILIRIEAVSINPRDTILMQGGYGRKGGKPPIVPLCDGSGRVEAVGEAVTGFAVGDRVCPHFSRSWQDGLVTDASYAGAHGGPLDGTMRELMTVPADAAAHVPGHLSAAEAATLPCAALTAWNAIAEQGGVKAGDRVLIQGTGGVALFALQFAKLMGAEVFLISSSDEKLERAAALGADHRINYRSDPDWHKTVRKLSGGAGLDHVVDVGGAGTLDRSVAALKPGASASLIGVLGGAEAQVPLARIVTQNIRLQGVTAGSCRLFRDMMRAIGHHRLHPVLHDVPFDFEDLPAALARLLDGGHFGKVTCTF